MPLTSILRKSKNKGFTLIELMVVMMILLIIVIVALVAVNPAQQFSKSHNTKRRSNVAAILNALNQYSANKNGLSALNIPPNTELIINSSGASGTINLCTQLTPSFISRLPVDPTTGNWQDCNNFDTRYSIMIDDDGRITVAAPDAELEETISVRQ